MTVSVSGAYAGFVNFWQKEIFASDCTTITSKDNIINNKLLFYIFKNKQEYFYSLQKGAAQPHVYGKDFQNLEIPLPIFAEQKKLVDIIEAKEKEIEAIKLFLTNIKNEKEAILTKHL